MQKVPMKKQRHRRAIAIAPCSNTSYQCHRGTRPGPSRSVCRARTLDMTSPPISFAAGSAKPRMLAMSALETHLAGLFKLGSSRGLATWQPTAGARVREVQFIAQWEHVRCTQGAAELTKRPAQSWRRLAAERTQRNAGLQTCARGVGRAGRGAGAWRGGNSWHSSLQRQASPRCPAPMHTQACTARERRRAASEAACALWVRITRCLICKTCAVNAPSRCNLPVRVRGAMRPVSRLPARSTQFWL